MPTPYIYPDPEDAGVSFADDIAYIYPDPEDAGVDFSIDLGGGGGPEFGNVTGFMPVHFGAVTSVIPPADVGQVSSWRAARFGVPITTGKVQSFRPVHFGLPVAFKVVSSSNGQHGHVYRLRPVHFGIPT